MMQRIQSFGARGLRRGWLVVAVTALVAAGDLAAATYKWTDEKGVVHYTDKMPPEAVDRASVEMSKEGVPLKKVDPALSAEQRRAREQEAERKRQAARQQEEVARRDRALLASYTSESEIDLARARAIGTIDAVMQSSRAYAEQLEKRRAEMTAKIAPFKTDGKPVPPVFERELDNVNQELGRQAELMDAKRKEMAVVGAKYDADKARFRELKTTSGLEPASSTAGLHK